MPALPSCKSGLYGASTTRTAAGCRRAIRAASASAAATAAVSFAAVTAIQSFATTAAVSAAASVLSSRHRALLRPMRQSGIARRAAAVSLSGYWPAPQPPQLHGAAVSVSFKPPLLQKTCALSPHGGFLTDWTSSSVLCCCWCPQPIAEQAKRCKRHDFISSPAHLRRSVTITSTVASCSRECSDRLYIDHQISTSSPRGARLPAQTRTQSHKIDLGLYFRS